MAKKNILDKVNQFIIDNPNESDVTIAERFSMSRDAVQKRRRRLRVAKPPPTDDFESKVLNILKKGGALLTVERLSDTLDVGVSRVKGAMESLKKKGHNIQILREGVELSRDIPRSKPTTIPISSLEGRVVKIGVTADNHLGSKYARMDVLNALFDIWAKEGVTDVYQGGNMIDGECRFNRFDLVAHGIQGQCEFFAQNWPKRKGINTHFVTGDDHEGWYVQREGIDIGKHLENVCREFGREDIHYLGHMEHDVIFKGKKQNAIMRVIHAGGGSSYATSYKVQKIVESYQGGEKPHILLVGHYHKAEYGFPREVHVLQMGTTKDQDTFMRKHNIAAHVGGWIVEFVVTHEGLISRFKCEWIPFYDRGFYEKRWKHHY